MASSKSKYAGKLILPHGFGSWIKIWGKRLGMFDLRKKKYIMVGTQQTK